MNLSPLASLLHWCSNSGFIVFIRDSKYGMPAVQSVHLVGITVLLATILVLDLRVARMGMMDWSLPWLERQLKPWALAAITLVILSGAVIFVGTPAKYLGSNPFRVKMTVLCLAILFHFGILRRFVTSESSSQPRTLSTVVAALSLTLWFTVGWAGRAIAFVP